MENKKDFYKEYCNEDGWIISPEDDIYDDLFGERFTESVPSSNNLSNLTSPFQFVIASVKYERNQSNPDGTFWKARPAVLIFKSGSRDRYYGFQVTTVGPHGNSEMGTQLRFPLKSNYGLRSTRSYLNYEHFVPVDIKRIGANLNVSLSVEDCKTLYNELVKNFDQLLNLYKNKNSRQDYKKLKSLLEIYLNITPELDKEE